LRQMVLSRFWFGWWGVKLSMADLTRHCSFGIG
jgi:purine-cytosine permease-like protein